LTAECQAFRGCLATKVIICRPADPEAKGLIERAHDYLERSFLPGRGFASPADFNAQLAGWVGVVNHRPRRVLGCAPAERIAADGRRCWPCQPLAPATGWRSLTRLARDHYVRLDGNDYSVHPGVIGRRVTVLADLSRVRVLCDGRCVADHERVWARHQSIADPEHVAAAAELRRDRISVVRPAPEPEVQVRRVADYDTALGLNPDADGGVA
jgi:transposase